MTKKRRTLAIVLGMPKSGKGTWVDKVKARYPKIPVIGVGDVCRAEEGVNSELFISAKRHMTEKGTTLWPTTELFLAFGRRFSEGVC